MKMRITFIILLASVSQLVNAQLLKNTVSLYLSPIQLNETSNYGLLFTRSIDKTTNVRVGLRVYVDTDKETRLDSVSLNEGRIEYDIRFGIQKMYPLGSFEKLQLYGSVDAYYNSMLKRESYETYYGYFWDFGFNPIIGLQYEPLNNVSIFAEAGSDLNLNFQEYSVTGPTKNSDSRVTYDPLGHLALGIGYKF